MDHHKKEIFKMQTWIEQIKTTMEARAAERNFDELAELEAFKLRTTPVIVRLRRFIAAMPESERNKPRPLEFYRQALKAKYHGKHAQLGETGEALRSLGFVRRRGWSSTEGGFRATWYPPVVKEK
jgi:hypothetical protein